MATKRGKAKKKNPCWKGYTAMGSDGKIVMKKKGDKMVPACRPIKGGASMKKDTKNKKEYIPLTKVGTDRKSQAKLRAEKAGLSKEDTAAYIKNY
jgi:hypothetical protein